MTNTPYPGITDAVQEARNELTAENTVLPPTTIGVYLKDSKRKYTYQCSHPVAPGDMVNVKLPHGSIITIEVIDVHPSPQLSDKWETKWAVVVQTKAERAAMEQESSDLGKELGL